MNTPGSLDIKRAKASYQTVSLFAKEGSDAQKKISSRLRELPALLLNHGLGQTLAFLIAKGRPTGDGGSDDIGCEKAWQALRDGLKELGALELSQNNCAAVCRWLGGDEHTDAADRRILMEALSYATWLKRWAEALLQTEDAPQAGGQ